MPDNKLSVPGARQAGFGLIELMVAVVLGLLITAAVTAMAVNSLKMSSDTLKSARLNQDLGAVMQIMTNDIRRAGYVGGAADFAAGEDINVVSSSCLLYSYNRDDDSTIGDNERNGFKLDGDNIQIRTSCNGANCMHDCSLGNWVDMLDSEVISITRFALDTEGSKCRNIDEETSVQIKPGSSATKFACNESTKAKLEQWGVDDDSNPGWVDVVDSITLPLNAYEDGDDDANNDDITSVGVRNVNISLEAELTGDSSVSKNLDVSTRVRNDYVYEVDES